MLYLFLYTKVQAINLSRNFGQHYAITAGLNYAKGEWVVVMDCDLQDRPEEIPNLYKKALGIKSDKDISISEKNQDKYEKINIDNTQNDKSIVETTESEKNSTKEKKDNNKSILLLESIKKAIESANHRIRKTAAHRRWKS